MFTCKLTGFHGKAIKSHVVPRAFYKLPEQNAGPLKLETNAPGVYPKKMPIGIYDQSIVTREGEDIFGPWDNYASRTLLQHFDKFEPIRDEGEVLAWRLPDVNYRHMKLFALSVLWRADASSHPVFAKVNLGPHEPALRKILLSGDAGNEELYSVCIARWDDESLGHFSMDPIRKRFEGINYYKVYCGRYVLDIKVDRRKTGQTFHSVPLAPDRDLLVIAKNLKRSNEWSSAVQIAHANRMR